MNIKIENIYHQEGWRMKYLLVHLLLSPQLCCWHICSFIVFLAIISFHIIFHHISSLFELLWPNCWPKRSKWTGWRLDQRGVPGTFGIHQTLQIPSCYSLHLITFTVSWRVSFFFKDDITQPAPLQFWVNIQHNTWVRRIKSAACFAGVLTAVRQADSGLQNQGKEPFFSLENGKDLQIYGWDPGGCV